MRVALPADATGTHVSVSVPAFLSAMPVAVIITSTLVVVCPVLEGDAVAPRLSDMRLVNSILQGNGQDGNMNTICIVNRRRLLVVPSAVGAEVLRLDNLKAGEFFCWHYCSAYFQPFCACFCVFLLAPPFFFSFSFFRATVCQALGIRHTMITVFPPVPSFYYVRLVTMPTSFCWACHVIL